MRNPRLLRPLAVLAGLFAAACDPAAFLRIRQSATPPGLLGCLEATLNRSSLVASAERIGSLPRFAVSLRDTLPAGNQGIVGVYLESPTDSATVLVVEYSWAPNVVGDLRPEERQYFVAAGTALGDELRARCLPDTPNNMTCVEDRAFGSSRPCIS